MIKYPDLHPDSPFHPSDLSEKATTRSSSEKKQQEEEIKQLDSELMRVIRNREEAEFLFVNELERAKVEVLIASSSLSYLRRLDNLGLLDSVEHATSRGVEILVLCPELSSQNNNNNTEQDITPNDSDYRLLLNLKKYAQVRGISGQIKGSVILTDNARVLSISEEGIDALAIYSDNKSLVNNFGSLFETLWIQKEILNDLIRSKDAILKSNEQLRRRDEMQKEFINIAAHELRTPVQPLLVITELIRKELESSDHVMVRKMRAEILVRNVKKLERLTSDILEVSRIESKSLVVSKETLDLNKMTAEAVADITTLIVAKHVQILYTPSKMPVVVDADASKVSQVITNLLKNAVKFTEEGKIELSVATKNKEAIVTVMDSGSGIDLSIMPLLFRKFSSRGQHGGTGLGLYISKAIVEAHSGRIWAENNKNGKGATFAFTLPLSESS